MRLSSACPGATSPARRSAPQWQRPSRQPPECERHSPTPPCAPRDLRGVAIQVRLRRVVRWRSQTVNRQHRRRVPSHEDRDHVRARTCNRYGSRRAGARSDTFFHQGQRLHIDYGFPVNSCRCVRVSRYQTPSRQRRRQVWSDWTRLVRCQSMLRGRRGTTESVPNTSAYASTKPGERNRCAQQPKACVVGNGIASFVALQTTAR